MKSILSAAVLIWMLMACRQQEQGIQGKWNSLHSEGFTLYFREDGTVDAFDNGKSFSSGFYKTSGDTIIVYEPNLQAYPAVYTLQFKGDKVTWHVVSDTLSGRRKAMDGSAFKRMND